MTIPPADPDPLDPDPLDADPLTDVELAVGAVADGTATPAQQAQVDVSASLQEHVALLGELRNRLAAPTAPLPMDAADDMIRVALASSPPARLGEDRSGDDPELAPTIGRRHDRAPWLVAAAVLLLLALGAVTVPRLTAGRASDSDTASSAAAITSTTAPASTRSNDGADSAPEGGSAAAAAGPSTESLFADSPLLALGEVATVAELVERALTALDGRTERAVEPNPDSGTTSDPVARACLAVLAPEAEPITLVATGTIDAVDHLVIVTALPGSDPPTRSVEVVRRSDCVVVDRSIR